MALNINKAKSWGALFMCTVFPAITLFYVSNLTNDLLMVFGSFFAVVFLSIILARIMLRHPLTQMIEGDGLLVWDMVSTGIARLFIIKLNNPNLQGKDGKNFISTLFSRNLLTSFRAPVEAGTMRQEKGEDGKEKILIELPKLDETKSIFALGNYTVLFYNSQIGSFLNKEILSTFEEKVFVHHSILDLGKKISALDSQIRPFASYVVELIKPKKNFFDNPLVLVAIIAILAFILLMLAPIILKALTDAGVLSAPAAPASLPASAVSPNPVAPIKT